MPASASISNKLQELGLSTVIGLKKAVQIILLNAKDNDIVNMTEDAAYSAKC